MAKLDSGGVTVSKVGVGGRSYGQNPMAGVRGALGAQGTAAARPAAHLGHLGHLGHLAAAAAENRRFWHFNWATCVHVGTWAALGAEK